MIERRQAHEAAQSARLRPDPRCPACYSRTGEPRWELAGGWRVVRCTDCGLLRTTPWPVDDEWESLYPADYPPHRAKVKAAGWLSRWSGLWKRHLLHWYRGYPTSSGAPARARLSAAVLWPVLGRFLDPYTPPLHGAARLLDVGCGAGDFLARMRGLGWDVLGVDRSARAALEARRRHGVEVVEAVVPGRELDIGSFDLITAWQVLEHLERPRSALAFLRRCLRPEGRLLLTVPNAAGWAASWFGESWIGWDAPRHLVHFDVDSLRAMLESEGFQVDYMCTLSHSGWIRHSARNAQKSRRRWLDRRLAGKTASRPLAAWQAKRGRGDSIYAVARAAQPGGF